MNVTLSPPATVLEVDEDGTIRVAGSRIILDIVIHAHCAGETPQQIAEAFPPLDVGTIHSVIGYYLLHQTELDAYLAERQRVAEELRKHFESDPRNAAFKAKILARRDARKTGS